MHKFQIEFPDFPAADMPAMPEGFQDSSWHNDACPSFHNPATDMIVYVDFADASVREFPEAVRFTVIRNDETLLATDDWQAVLALIDVD